MIDLPLFGETRSANATEQGARLPPKRARAKPAKTLQEAAARRDEAIEAGLSRADRVKAEWRQWAYDYFKGLVALTTKPFLAEDLIEQALAEAIWCPAPDPRAYGGIFKMLAKDKVIMKVGYASARTSHASPKTLWMKTEVTSEAVIQNRPEGA